MKAKNTGYGRSRWQMSRVNNKSENQTGDENLFSLYHVDENINMEFDRLLILPNANLKFPHQFTNCSGTTSVGVTSAELKFLLNEYCRLFDIESM
jgi:hypothetical protein